MYGAYQTVKIELYLFRHSQRIYCLHNGWQIIIFQTDGMDTVPEVRITLGNVCE